ncbi:MAG: translation elongation factor Ts [Actinomycetota bacterium]|nr:translation elongation factor Ts [Actinomycetota bacterium]
MADFTATDVKRLRDQTGAGMMDAKKALVETEGDFGAAAKWLREKGLASAGQRAGRESSQGAVALARAGNVAALVELKCETDFVAKSPDFVSLANDLAQLVADEGEQAIEARKDDVDNLKLTLKENISLGRVVRFEAAEGNVLDTYLHVQSGRGVNAVLVELAGGDRELAHDIAVHAAFAKPVYLTRDEVPEETVAEERATYEAQARNSGKPEAALAKIVDGMLTGWFKERVLLDQPFAKDDKQSVQQVLGDTRVVRFAQVVIGG